MLQTRSKLVRLYVVEEDQICREIYRAVLPSRAPIELLEVSGNDDFVDLKRALSRLSPDVVLLSINRLDEDIIKELEQIRVHRPGIGMILLLASCGAQDIEPLRKLTLRGDGGIALFLKQPLDQIERLCRAITAVSQGQVIIDPPLATFVFAGNPESRFLRQLTPRELEILKLLAQGDTHTAISHALSIDIKTVEHHLNSIYNKLKVDPEFCDKHLRVSAAKLYLEAMGYPGFPNAAVNCIRCRPTMSDNIWVAALTAFMATEPPGNMKLTRLFRGSDFKIVEKKRKNVLQEQIH